MSDASGGVSSVQGWMDSVQSTMSDLASQMQAAVPSGNFAAVLANVQALFSSPAASATLTSATSGGGSISAQLSDPGASGATGVSGSAVVNQASQFLGVPYVWGGTTPSGFDCSGFVQYVYGQLGVSLPRTSEQQAQVGTAVESVADAEPGDLVFYPGSDGTASAPGHVGIYLGNGEMIDAPQTGQSVSVQAVGSPVAIRRVLSDASSPAGSTALGSVSTGGSATATSPATLTTSPATLTTSAATTASGTSSTAVPADLAPLFVAAAGRYGVPVTLLTAVGRTESGFNPNAVSSAGAEGLMQLMPTTAASLGVDPFDPAQAIDGAAQLLSGYLKQFGSLPLALAAYNAGPGAVEQYGGVPPYPQTEAYVQSITQSLQSAS